MGTVQHGTGTKENFGFWEIQNIRFVGEIGIDGQFVAPDLRV